MIPRPPLNLSNLFAGYGLTMSKKRKRINESMTATLDQCANSVNGNNAINWPATSSTTTLPGSFRPDNSSILDPAQIPANVTTTIATRTTAINASPAVARASNKKIPTPTNDPNVPGASGEYPTPHVAIDNAR